MMFLVDHILRSFLEDIIGSVGGSSSIKVDDGNISINDVKPSASHGCSAHVLLLCCCQFGEPMCGCVLPVRLRLLKSSCQV